MDKVGALIVTSFIAGILAFSYLIYDSAKETKEFKESCEARGGTVVRSRDFTACVDPKIFK